MLSQPLIQRTLGSNSLKGSSLELSEGLNYPGGLPLLVSVGKRLPYKWLSLGSSRGGVWGGGVEQGPRCHPHTASSCEREEWLVCNYVWHSSHCCTVCSAVAQELAPTPGQTGGLKAALSVPGAKWWASVSSVLYWNLKMRVL